MKKIRLVTIAFIVVGTLNLLGFVYLTGHGEYSPASYSQDYLSSPSACNVPAQVPAWVGHMR